MDGMLTKRFVVRGRVQGVGFRDWTRRRAAAGGLAGWVRNRPDGSVEGVGSGPGPGRSGGDSRSVRARERGCLRGWNRVP